MKNSFEGINCSYDPDKKTSPTGFTWKQLAEYRENNYREILRLKGVTNPTFEQLLVWDGYPEPYSKYKRMLNKNINKNHFVAFDVETANKNPESICSIGIVEVIDGEIVNEKYLLVKPIPCQVDYWNYKTHGISENMLRDQPTFEEIWHELEPFFKIGHVIGHNVDFDKRCLRYALSSIGKDIFALDIQFVCTLKLSKKIYDLENYKLPTVCTHIGHEIGSHHDALDDARGSAMIYIDLLDNNNEDDLQENVIENTKKIKYKKSTKSNINISELKSKTTKRSKRLANYIVVFTGELECMTREVAMRKIIELGGNLQTSVQKTTTHLVFGGDDTTTLKYRRAIELDLKILRENDLLQIIKGD